MVEAAPRPSFAKERGTSCGANDAGSGVAWCAGEDTWGCFICKGRKEGDGLWDWGGVKAGFCGVS